MCHPWEKFWYRHLRSSATRKPATRKWLIAPQKQWTMACVGCMGKNFKPSVCMTDSFYASTASLVTIIKQRRGLQNVMNGLHMRLFQLKRPFSKNESHLANKPNRLRLFNQIWSLKMWRLNGTLSLSKTNREPIATRFNSFLRTYEKLWIKRKKLSLQTCQRVSNASRPHLRTEYSKITLKWS